MHHWDTWLKKCTKNTTAGAFGCVFYFFSIGMCIFDAVLLRHQTFTKNAACRTVKNATDWCVENVVRTLPTGFIIFGQFPYVMDRQYQSKTESSLTTEDKTTVFTILKNLKSVNKLLLSFFFTGLFKLQNNVMGKVSLWKYLAQHIATSQKLTTKNLLLTAEDRQTDRESLSKTATACNNFQYLYKPRKLMHFSLQSLTHSYEQGFLRRNALAFCCKLDHLILNK